MAKVAGSRSRIRIRGSISQRHGSADSDPSPDPYQNVMGLQHWYTVNRLLTETAWDLFLLMLSPCCRGPTNEKPADRGILVLWWGGRNIYPGTVHFAGFFAKIGRLPLCVREICTRTHCKASLETSVVDPYLVDPIKIDLLDPDLDPYYLSKIQKNFRKNVLIF